LTQTAQNNTWASGQRIPVTLTDNDDNKNGKLSERMFLWDPTYKRSTAMVIGNPFTLSSGGAAAENATLINSVHQSQDAASGLYIFRSNGALINMHNSSSTNLQEDEAFSARPIFNFTNQTLAGQPTANPQVGSGTGLFIDLKTTMNTLLKTIHNANRTKNTEG